MNTKPIETPEEIMFSYLHSMGTYLDMQVKGEAGIVSIHPLIFTHAIVSGMNLSGYEDRWCYRTYEMAKAALDAWDGTGEPKGWHRHPDTDRRKEPEDWK